MISLIRNQLSLAIFLIAALSNQQITALVHCDTINIVLDYINPNLQKNKILIILDIDNTIAHAYTAPDYGDYLGTDQWFKEMVKSYEKQGFTTECAINEVLPLYFAIHHHYPLIPVEPTTVSCIKCLQTKAQVISLTARSPEFSTRTLEQLHAIDIHFDRSPVYGTDLTLAHTHPALFKGGILFAGNNNKGDILLTFLETIKYTPEQIIFIDDKDYNCNFVKKAAQTKKIDVVVIRHSKLDTAVANFNFEKTVPHVKNFTKKHSETIAHYRAQVPSVIVS